MNNANDVVVGGGHTVYCVYVSCEFLPAIESRACHNSPAKFTLYPIYVDTLLSLYLRLVYCRPWVLCPGICVAIPGPLFVYWKTCHSTHGAAHSRKQSLPFYML